jgi:hypothetical protein
MISTLNSSFLKQDPGLINNFLEIGTGEGKSITLAITSYVLAMLGY